MGRGVSLLGRPVLFLFLAGVAQASDPSWERLLHFRHGRSQADGKDFFLAPNGKRDPQAELEATLKAFREPEPEGERAQHPICRFPARYEYLRRAGYDVPPPRACPRFDEWRAQLEPEGVVLIFADAFLNNPASMYGHTFLRLKRKESLPGEELLDYTVNFAGNPDTGNALLYTIKGLMGGFPGTFSTMPYYLKAREYNDIESRDLWEYELNLSTRSLDMLVRHAWEMGSTHFDYFFFDENCSYQLLTLIDAADPSLDLAGDYLFWVIPIDTLRSFLDRPGLVKSWRYRPSLRSEAAARAKRKPADAAEAEALRLEGEYDRWKLSKRSKSDPEHGKQLLSRRAKLGIGPVPYAVSEPAPPHAAHRTERAGLGFGVSDGSSFEELWWRAALHDLAERPDGMVPGSQLEMGDLALRFDNRKKEPYLERFDLIDIVSLSPGKVSWKAVGGVDQAKELGCRAARCQYVRLNAGVGAAAKVSSHYAYVFGEGDAGAGPILDDGWRAGGGGTAGILFTFPRARLQVEATYLAYSNSRDNERLRVTGSVDLTKELELRVTLDRETPAKEAGAVLLLHY